MQQSPNLEWKNDANNNIKRCSFSTAITSNIDLPKVNLLTVIMPNHKHSKQWQYNQSHRSFITEPVTSGHAQQKRQQAMMRQPITCNLLEIAICEYGRHLKYLVKFIKKPHKTSLHYGIQHLANSLTNNLIIGTCFQLSSSQPCKLQIQPEMIGTLQLLSFLKQLQPKTISRLPSTKYVCDKVCKGILNKKSKTIIYHRLNLT